MPAPRAQGWPPGLRAYLLALVLAVLLPALVFGVLASREALQQREDAAEARLRDTARALSAAVDTLIGAHVAALRVLAAAPEEGEGVDLGHLREHADATAEMFGAWVNLYRRDGSQLFTTRLPIGAALPGPGGAIGPGGGGRTIAEIFDTGMPKVSNIATGRLSGQPTAFVFVPVLRRGRVAAVLGMPLLPRLLSATLAGQAVEGKGAAALTDGNGLIAARSRAPEGVVGQQRPPRDDPGPVGESGVLRGRSLTDDVPIRTAYHRLSAAPGWHVWVNEPEASFAAARQGPLMVLAAGALLALAIGLGGAAIVGRRLLAPVHALVAQAEILAGGGTQLARAARTPAGVAEFERLRRAVLAAEAALLRVQRIGRVGGFTVDLPSGASWRSAEYMAVQGLDPVPAFESHADWVARLHPEDRERAERHLLDAIADDGAATDYEQEYRVLTPAGEVRWIYARAEIERDAAGRAVRMVGAHVDVTALKAAEAALRDSEERLRLALEAAQLGAWEMDLATGEVKRSARSIEILGLAEGEGDAALPLWSTRVHPEDRAAVHAAIDAVKAGSEQAYRVQFRFLRPDGRWVWVESHGRAAGLHPRSGRPARLIGTTEDITARKQAEERQEVLIHELDHRAKNTLAVVQAALRLTPRRDVASYARAVEGRVAALARAHTLLAQGRWRGAALRQVAEDALAPFVAAGQGGPRATIEGPMVELSPMAVQAVSMAFHELATNAAKYGALSVPEGRLALEWEIRGGMLHLAWQELGGPAVPGVPESRGFGGSLVEATILRQLGGRFEASWRPEGLAWRAWLPLSRLLPGVEAPAAERQAALSGDGPGWS